MIDTENLDGFDPLLKLDRATTAMAAGLDRQSALALVDLYYTFQGHRIALGNQTQAMRADESPAAEIISHFYGQTHTLEKEMIKALNAWVKSSKSGLWLIDQKGIGPVIAAGLLAHIDITKAPTVGHIWRFAGLDPTVKWHGTKAADELMRAAFEVESTGVDALWWLSEAVNRRFTDLITTAEIEPASRNSVVRAVAKVGGADRSDVEQLFQSYPLYDDNAVRHAAREFGFHPVAVYRELYGDLDNIERKPVQSLIAKRPWNAKLKVLCWKIGDSLVKVSNRDGAFYGQLYRERKQLELDRNEAGAFADQAADTLRTKNIKDRDLRQVYESGRLPAGRLELRARRYAVKLLLAHLHGILHENVLGRPAPLPYPIAHLDHAHVIEAPGLSARALDEAPAK